LVSLMFYPCVFEELPKRPQTRRGNSPLAEHLQGSRFVETHRILQLLRLNPRVHLRRLKPRMPEQRTDLFQIVMLTVSGVSGLFPFPTRSERAPRPRTPTLARCPDELVHQLGRGLEPHTARGAKCSLTRRARAVTYTSLGILGPHSAPPRAPVPATPISWMPAGTEPRRPSRAATRSDPT